MVNRTRVEGAKKYIQKRQNTSKEAAIVPGVPVSPVFIFVLSSRFLFATFVGLLLFFHFISVWNSPLTLFTLFFIIHSFVSSVYCTTTMNQKTEQAAYPILPRPAPLFCLCTNLVLRSFISYMLKFFASISQFGRLKKYQILPCIQIHTCMSLKHEPHLSYEIEIGID